MIDTENLNSLEHDEQEEYVLDNIDYIVEFTKLISVLRRGCDVMQLPNGDSIISQTKVVHTHYKWDNAKKKFVKFTQYENK
jgi:hypothetical protein